MNSKISYFMIPPVGALLWGRSLRLFSPCVYSAVIYTYQFKIYIKQIQITKKFAQTTMIHLNIEYIKLWFLTYVWFLIRCRLKEKREHFDKYPCTPQLLLWIDISFLYVFYCYTSNIWKFWYMYSKYSVSHSFHTTKSSPSFKIVWWSGWKIDV